MMQLPLLGDDPGSHDWHNILGSLDLLEYTEIISRSIYAAGVSTMICATALSLIVLKRESER